MYLALKWLIFLVIAMWALLCSVDLYNKSISQGSAFRKPIVSLYKNHTKEKSKSRNSQRHSMAFLNYLTFIAGALAVTLYNKKSEIIRFTRETLNDFSLRSKVVKATFNLKVTVIYVWVAFVEKTKPLWEKIKNRISFTKINLYLQKGDDNRKERNMLLLRRLREVGLERNKIGQLLVTAIRENKNIKLQYHLENLAKKRLMQQVLETQRQIRENRSKNIAFRQIHLVTHQENIFLKSRLKKLAKDKEEAEANLMKLISRVYQSSDNNLKAYCTCFMVKTKENFMTPDLNANIATFLQNCLSSCSTRLSESSNEEDVNASQNLPSSSVSAISQKENPRSIVPFPTEEPKPKLRGLPGEYMWTIKDKDGIIEKLYEYDYGYNFDNGDTIRRIREYSVYHDSDCLLDIANSKSSIIYRESSCSNLPKQPTVNIPSNRKFLTESPVFQQFLKRNINLAIGRSPSPPLLCG